MMAFFTVVGLLVAFEIISSFRPHPLRHLALAVLWLGLIAFIWQNGLPDLLNRNISADGSLSLSGNNSFSSTLTGYKVVDGNTESYDENVVGSGSFNGSGTLSLSGSNTASVSYTDNLKTPVLFFSSVMLLYNVFAFLALVVKKPEEEEDEEEE